MTTSAIPTMAIFIDEVALIKIILEFLESRHLHIAQLSLERETGIINGCYNEDILFLRELIICGQWDSALNFVEPLKEVDGFDITLFRYYIAKYKFFELLCIKQEPGPLHDHQDTVEEIVECLREVEKYCPNNEEFRQLCALLTLPRLTDHQDFKFWNPSSARVDCFNKILPLVMEFIGSLKEEKSGEFGLATNDRFLQLIVKGLLYEKAMDFCQNKALQRKNAQKMEKKCPSPNVLSQRPQLSSTDLSLVSWLEFLGNEQFVTPFQQCSLDLKIEALRKPRLEAKWGEQILATPIQPDQFPYSLVTHSKFKCVEKISQSMIIPTSLAVSQISNEEKGYGKQQCLASRLKRTQAMSYSTMATVGFTITRNQENLNLEDEVMQQSQLISDMFLSEDHASSSSNPDSTRNKYSLPSVPEIQSLRTASSTSTLNSVNENDSVPNKTESPNPLTIHPNENNFSLEQECNKSSNVVLRENRIHSTSKEFPEPTSVINPVCQNPELVAQTNRLTLSGETHQQQNLSRIYSSAPLQLQNPFYPSSYCGQNFAPTPTTQIPPSGPYFTPINQTHNFQYYYPPTSMLDPSDQYMQGIPINGHRQSYYGQYPSSMPIREQVAVRPKSFVWPFPAEYEKPFLNQNADTLQKNSFDGGCIDEAHQKSSEGLAAYFIPICRYTDSQAIRAVAFHPSGNYFSIGTNSKSLLVCKYSKDRRVTNHEAMSNETPLPTILLNRPRHHKGSVYCCGFNSAGTLLATGSNDKSIRLMKFNSISENECRITGETELLLHDGTIRDLIFVGASSPEILVTGGAGNCHICLTDCIAAKLFKSFVGHTAPILGLYTWNSSNNFVSCSSDRSVRFWDLRVSNATNVVLPTDSSSINPSPITNVCVDSNGKLLISGHEDSTITLYDIIGGRVVQKFRPHVDEVRTVRLSNAAFYLLSGSFDKRIVITDMRGDLSTQLSYKPIAAHNDKVIQCRWHPSQFSFLSTSADKTAVLWSLPTKG